MIKKIKKILGILNQKQRKQLYVLQVLIIFMSIFEVIGISSIGPLIAVIGDTSIIHSQPILHSIYQFLEIETEHSFLIFLATTSFVLITVGSIFSIITTWFIFFYSHKIGVQIGDKLYDFYIHQPWLYHSSKNSAYFITQIGGQVQRFMAGVIQPILVLNSKLALIFFISFTLILIDPMIIIVTMSLIGGAYFLIYKLLKNKLFFHGQQISELMNVRTRLMNEAFGGIKDTLLLKKQNIFKKKFITAGDQIAFSGTFVQVVSAIPRYIIELFAIGMTIIIIFYLLNSFQGNLSKVLAVLAVYSLAGLKLLPACQQVYASIATIKGNIASFYVIQKDLSEIEKNNLMRIRKNELIKGPQFETIVFKQQIELSNISLKYPNKETFALNELNLKIPYHHTIGLVGGSGSGKTTAIDVLLGLIPPTSGKLIVDDIVIETEQQSYAWQKLLGYVPQSIFLTGGSIAENIAFSLDQKLIDFKQIDRAIQLAHLDEFVKKLPEGVHTLVGERGVQLSGGQRQRVGIARTLYHNAEVLLLDEATSALDGITEKLIMEAIQEFAGKKTLVIVAHRLKTIKKCDIIYLFENGKVIDSGNYEQLVNNNAIFEKMAQYS